MYLFLGNLLKVCLKTPPHNTNCNRHVTNEFDYDKKLCAGCNCHYIPTLTDDLENITTEYRRFESIGVQLRHDIVYVLVRRTLKVNLSPYRPGQAPQGFITLRLPEFSTVGIRMWQSCQPQAPSAFTPQGRTPGTHFY